MKTLVKGTRLYLQNRPTLKYRYTNDESIEEGYNLSLFYEKLDNNEFGWWCYGKYNPIKRKEDHAGVRMNTPMVYHPSMNHFTLFFPNDWINGLEVKHKSIGSIGKISNIIYLKDVPYIGVFWYHGQKKKYYSYYWNRFDELSFI